MSSLGAITKLREFLYLSSLSPVKTTNLTSLGITCVVDASGSDSPRFKLDDFEYVKIKVEDNVSARIHPFLERIANKIEEVRKKGGKTLVHCIAGISRSVSLCIAYLITFENFTLRKAYTSIREKRSIIRPNNGFWVELIAYEKSVLGSSSVAMVPGRYGNIPDIVQECDQKDHGQDPEFLPAKTK